MKTAVPHGGQLFLRTGFIRPVSCELPEEVRIDNDIMNKI